MPRAKRLILVDSDAVLRSTLAEQLAGEEPYDIVPVGSIANARIALAEPADAVLIDQTLPDGSGENFAAELRGGGFSAPILLLTDSGNALEGVDNLAKPFRLAALLAWLKAQLGQVGDAAPITVGPYEFRPATKLLTDAAQRKIRLTEKEANILKYLHAAGRTVPRETLLHEVWGYNPAVSTHTLETHIYRLRRKIEENPGKARILVSEDGGYRLAGPAKV